MACQMFTVNMTSLCSFHREDRHRYFCGPTILWEGIGKKFWKRNRINCQRCNINLTNPIRGWGKWLVRGLLLTWQVCTYFAEKIDTGIFVVLSFHGRELVRDFRGIDGIKSLRIFSKPSAIKEFGMSLPTTVWVGLVMLFFSAWWVVEDLCWT